MDETHPGARQLAAAGEWYVRAISNNDTSRGKEFCFSGSTGCGKTHAARAIYRFVQAWGPDILLKHRAPHWASMWVDWPNVAELDDEDDFKDIRQQVADATFIVLDDIGSESDRFKNGVPASRLRRILSEIERKWVVVTTNLSLDELLRTYDARTADRFRAFQHVSIGRVESYRPKLNRL